MSTLVVGLALVAWALAVVNFIVLLKHGKWCQQAEHELDRLRGLSVDVGFTRDDQHALRGQFDALLAYLNVQVRRVPGAVVVEKVKG